MASPQRKMPEQNPPTLENLPEVEKQIGTGRPFSWSWLWIPVIIAAFWFVGWGWGPYGGWWWGHGPGSASQSARATAPAPPNNNAQPANGARAGGFNTATNAPVTSPQGPVGATPRAAVTGTGVAVLDASNKSAFVGQNFQIQGIPVQKDASAHAVWIGTNNTRNAGPMLLILPKGITNVPQGAILNASGTIEKAPPVKTAEHEWSLSGADARLLAREGAYVQAAGIQTRG